MAKRLPTRKDTARITFTTFTDYKTRADRMAKEKKVSLSTIINEALKKFIK